MDALDLAACTFDCYGTLVDWEGGAASFLYQYALRQRDPQLPPGSELRDRWEQIQFDCIHGDYRKYSEVLADSLRIFAEERGWRYQEADGVNFQRSMRSWQPFPDTIHALKAAKEAGLRLVILSNTDRDIIEHTLKQLKAPIDDVITAEDVRSYKPRTPHFDRALNVIGEPAERILHVAFGFKYDIGPAKELGFKTAWVNRHQRRSPGVYVPDYEWRDLWGLTELVQSSTAQ